MQSAIKIVANENRYHPVRDYLNSLQWDGTERIRYALHHFLGADTDEYTYEALKLFLMGAIRRVFRPGASLRSCSVWLVVRSREIYLFPAAGRQGRMVFRRFEKAGR